MPDHLKLPFAQSLNRFSEKKAEAAIQKTGRSLPCSVVEIISSGIVKVKFEVDAAPFTLPNLIVAKWGAEYIRYPTQVGDKGYVSTSDARLGGVTGLGAGVASLTQPGNLAALVFNPLGNTAWSSVDPNVLVMYGPEGVEIRDAGSGSVIGITSTSITLTHGIKTITVDMTGIAIHGDVTITGGLTVTGDTSFGGGSKKVVLDGDPVSGGAVHASSTTIKAT